MKIVEPEIEVTLSDPYSSLNTWIWSRRKTLEIKNNHVFDIQNNKDLGSVDNYNKDLLNMDFAINYFQSITIRLKTSIFLREFFYTFQEYKGKWAMTHRNSTVTEFPCSKEMYQGKITDDAFKKFESETNKYNKSQIKGDFDEVKELMPLAYQVEYELHLPIKQFIKILAVLVQIVGESSSVWTEIYSICYKNDILKPYLKNISKYYDSEELHKYSDFNTLTQCNFDPTYEDFGNIGCTLYSHLIRHEDTITSGYFDFMKKIANQNFDELPSHKSEFHVYIKQSPKRRLEMIKLRTEWFAMTDRWNSNNTWGAILKKYIPDNPKLEECTKYLNYFDSEGNWDSSRLGLHAIDDSVRVRKGYNAYFPNAFLLESRKILDQRIARYGMNPLLDLYTQIFDKGYVVDNPDNEMRKYWESLENKKGDTTMRTSTIKTLKQRYDSDVSILCYADYSNNIPSYVKSCIEWNSKVCNHMYVISSTKFIDNDDIVWLDPKVLFDYIKSTFTKARAELILKTPTRIKDLINVISLDLMKKYGYDLKTIFVLDSDIIILNAYMLEILANQNHSFVGYDGSFYPTNLNQKFINNGLTLDTVKDPMMKFLNKYAEMIDTLPEKYNCTGPHMYNLPDVKELVKFPFDNIKMMTLFPQSPDIIEYGIDTLSLHLVASYNIRWSIPICHDIDFEQIENNKIKIKRIKYNGDL